MTIAIDLNCDMGESYGRWQLGADEEIMPFITSASVACGFHGGDPHVMRKTVDLALAHGVAVGSHPSLPDLMGFGRRAMAISPQELKDCMCYQTGALREFLRVRGALLQHVKAHGILYDMMEKDAALALAACEACRESGGADLIMVVLAGGKCDSTARSMGLTVASEGFADRGYNADGTLVKRGTPGALLDDEDAALAQTLAMVREQRVKSIDGAWVPIRAQTVCLHGDGAHALAFARRIRERLGSEGIAVRAGA